MASPEDPSEQSVAASNLDGSPTTSRRLSILRLATGTAAPAARAAPPLPNRYRVRSEGGVSSIACLEAPTIAVRLERGFSVTANAARGYAAGTIFLDGAAQGPPFLDVERAVFNLDHHEGCVRNFTLATCEQAYVLVAKGLDLQAREWTVYANEPDLDTLLAIWVLLNHRRLRLDPRLRRRVLPLLRLEGAIDVHGFDLRDLCGFPQELSERTFGELEQIGQPEIDAKREGQWGEVDYAAFAADRLYFIDGLVYEPGDLTDQAAVEELARAELPERRLAVACRSEEGIYRVEEQLREVYGDRLGLVILEKESRQYTIRQVDSFLGSDLGRVYDALNLADPAAGNRRSSNRWGGSDDIGGSPRSTGTRLRVAEITELCARAFRRPTFGERLAAIAVAAVASGIVVLAASLPFFTFAADALAVTPRTGGLAAAILALGTLTLLGALWHGPGFAGLRRPVGLGWVALVPVALLAAGGGGSWTLSYGSAPLTATTFAVALLFAVAVEALFRGVVYGHLLAAYGGSATGWRARAPFVVSSLIYGLWSLLPLLPLARRSFESLGPLAVTFVAAAVFGLACGLARERSESLLPPLLIHATAAALVLAARLS